MPFIHYQAILKPVPIIDSQEWDWLPELDKHQELNITTPFEAHDSTGVKDSRKKWRWDLLFLHKVVVFFLITNFSG